MIIMEKSNLDHMKSTCYRNLSLTVMLFLSVTCLAQDLEIVRDGKVKSFETGTFIEVQLPAPSHDENNPCDRSLVTGQLVRSEGNQIVLKVVRSEEPLMQGKTRLGQSFKKYDELANSPELSIPKEIILGVMHKGNKRVRENTTMETIATILIAMGTGHLVSVPVVEIADKGSEAGDALLWLGAAEVVTGLILGPLSQQKLYITSDQCPQKTKSDKVWAIR
jgi:hypothetical protein